MREWRTRVELRRFSIVGDLSMSPSILVMLVMAMFGAAVRVGADRKFDARIVNSPPSQDLLGGPVGGHISQPSASVPVEKPSLPLQDIGLAERNFGVVGPSAGPGHHPSGYGPPPPGSWSSVTLDVATGSRLTVRPGEPGRLNYEVNNLRTEPQPVAFSAGDTLGLIRFINPPRLVVAPRGTARVTVELLPARPGSEGIVNTVTLAAQAMDGTTAVRPALIKISNEKEDEDHWAPHCWFSVPWGQCRNFEHTGSSCAATGWNAEVTVRDDYSGLLKVESSPPGNLAPNRYAAGTRAPVTLLMAASCCQETMQIKVWDASGNSKTCEAYVYGLTPAEIASIVLAVILLIALLVLILLACLLCRSRRNRRKHDIPHRPRSST